MHSPGWAVNFPLFLAILGALLALRVAAQWWARAPAAPASWRGRLSVWTWALLWLVLLGGALWRIHRDELLPVAATIVVLLSLALRAAGLVALRGHYHEGIATRDGHAVVRHGIYRWLRHPLHLALLGEMTGFALAWREPAALPLLVVALVVTLHRNLLEERLLCESLGEDYRRYLAGSAWDLVDLLPRRSPARSQA